MIHSGEISGYVHPRYIKFIKFAAIVMILIAIFLTPEIFKPQRFPINSSNLIIFLIPLVFAFLIPASSVDLAARTNSNFGSNSSSQVSISNRIDSAKQGGEYYNIDGPIVMDDSNYVRIYLDVYANLAKYEGKEIEMVGFVYRGRNMSDDLFVPARNMMVCCIADMQTIGFLSRYENADSLTLGSWVKVKGRIDKTPFKDTYIPTVDVSSIEEVRKPEIEYVYVW